MKFNSHGKRWRLATTTSLLGRVAFLCLLAAGGVGAQGPDELHQTLVKAQATVARFADDFSYLRYEEDILQQKLRNNEKVAYGQEMVYDSMIRMRFENGKLKVDEQRMMEKKPRRVEARPLLNTYGFSTLAMIFHPYYESSFRFELGGNDVLQGRSLVRVKFAHLPGTPTPALYQMIGPDRPLEVSGTAWIDPDSGDIYRIDAQYETGVADAGVKTIRAALTYGPIQLQDEKAPQFLPVSATIDLETARQHWRNVHHFSDYRKFRVAMNMPGVETQ
ncbi:MAG TPA: hypothetical protein VJO53_05190 [Candidatus Acidoferrales bacterium]|nr:hypothetical protein [Candidatus Acidoferrales bacterium]